MWYALNRSKHQNFLCLELEFTFMIMAKILHWLDSFNSMLWKGALNFLRKFCPTQSMFALIERVEISWIFVIWSWWSYLNPWTQDRLNAWYWAFQSLWSLPSVKPLLANFIWKTLWYSWHLYKHFDSLFFLLKQRIIMI